MLAQQSSHSEAGCNTVHVPDRVLDRGLEAQGLEGERRLVLSLHLQLHLVRELAAQHLQELGDLGRALEEMVAIVVLGSAKQLV